MRYDSLETIEQHALRLQRNPGTMRGLLRNIRKTLHRCIHSQLQTRPRLTL
jgi:hypothetical protein